MVIFAPVPLGGSLPYGDPRHWANPLSDEQHSDLRYQREQLDEKAGAECKTILLVIAA